MTFSSDVLVLINADFSFLLAGGLAQRSDKMSSNMPAICNEVLDC